MAVEDGQQSLKLKSRGKFTHPNRLGSIPPGGMITATNTVIDKDDVIETKRGTKKYIESMASLSKQLLHYKDRILVHFGSTLGYDSDGAGTKVDYTGTFDPPSTQRMRSIRANQNLYFTTDEGVKRIDTLTATPVDAGGIKALDGEAALSGASGFMATATQRAYRIVWGFKDANENLILGAPSQRITIANSTGGTRDVDLTFTIPDGITTSHFYQVYRSGASATATDEANDELQLVIEDFPTSAEITAEEVTVTDSVPDALRGAKLYTNPSEQGIAQANDVPPLCVDMTVFKNHALYANTETKQRLFINMISVDSPQLSFYDVTGDTSIGSDQITNLSSTTGLAIGQLVTGTGIPADTLVTNIAGTTATISNDATANGTGVSLRFRDRITFDGEDWFANDSEDTANNYFLVTTSGTPASNIADTARSLVKIINKTATSIYAFYISNFDDLPGKLLIEDRQFGGAVWDATSSKGSAWSPTLNASGSDNQSSNERKKNEIFISKSRQPDAVPLLQSLPAGSEDDEIKRIIALRDSVIILKDDGIFRMTGEDVNSFSISIFDDTAIIKGADTADKLNNEVFCYSTQGAISISDNGVKVRSRPIEQELLEVSSDDFSNFDDVAFGVGYESERKYILFVPTSTSDTFAKKGHVFNTFTSAWTDWAENRTCGIVNPGDNRLYLGDGDANHIRKERKSFKLTDYANDEFSVTISSFSGTTVTLSSTADAVVGQTLAQIDSNGNPARQAKVLSIAGSDVVVDRTVMWNLTTPAAKLYDPIAINMKWAPIHAENPGILHHFPEVTMFFRQASFRNLLISFSSNLAEQSTPISVSPVSQGAWGSGTWGGIPWGGSTGLEQPIRTYLPLEQQRANWVNMSIAHTEALTNPSIEGFSMPSYPMSERMK